MFMLVFEVTLNLTENQATNQEAAISPEQEQRPFCKPWDMNWDKSGNQQTQKSSYKGKGIGN